MGNDAGQPGWSNTIPRVIVSGGQRIKVRDRDLTTEAEVTETETGRFCTAGFEGG